MLVNIKEIGDVEGMVDTGAKITGISLDSLSEDLSRRENRTYQPGDLVIVARRRVHVGKTKKFVCRSIGPYQVAKRVSKTCYTVEDLP